MFHSKPKIVRDRIREGGGGGGGGDPIDAIVGLRRKLGEAFERVEPDWKTHMDAALDAAGLRLPRGPAEDDAAYTARLRQEVVADAPAFVRRLEGRVRLFAFLLGHPGNKLVRDDIVPLLDDWHRRCGTAVDFVCLGLSERSDETPDGRGFNQIVRLFEKHFDWKYSGQTDLLAFNGRYDMRSREAIFDLSQVVAMTLEQALETRAIGSVSALMEAMFRAAAEHDGDNPAWAFSDAQGARLAGSGIKRFLLSLLPEWARADAERGLFFHVRDLSPRRR